MLVDSHCHLLHCYGKIDDQHIRMIEKEFALLVNISTNINEIKEIFNYNLKSSVILNAYGLYPDLSKNFDENMKREFLALVDQFKPVAIGEIGIDLHHNYGEVYLQEKLFRFQLELAIEKDLPVIIHSRESFKDVYRILSSYNFNKAVIMHCFGYGKDEAFKFLDLGFYISFAGNVTFPNAAGLRDVLKIVPLSRLLIETDAPYLTPVPLRGKRNTPFNIKYTYYFISDFLDIEKEKLEETVEMNLRHIIF